MSAHPVSSRRPLALEHPARVGCVRIDWGISRMALGELAPGGDCVLITLRYRARPDEGERWSLLDPASGCVAPVSERLIGHASSPSIRCAGGRVHIHSPMLYAFISLDAGECAELLYARTPVFGLLGIRGGRYQPLGASVELS